MSEIHIRGYCDKPNVAPGQEITFYVSCDQEGPYEAQFVNLVNGDVNPKGPGFRDLIIDNPVNGIYKGHKQRTQAGGHVEIPDPESKLAFSQSFTIHAFISAMLPEGGRQGIISRWNDTTQTGWALMIQDGALTFVIGNGSSLAQVSCNKLLFKDTFYSVTASYDAVSKTIRLRQKPVVNSVNSRFGLVFPLDSEEEIEATAAQGPGDALIPVVIGGLGESFNAGRTWVTATFNGKIDSPSVYRISLGKDDIRLLESGMRPAPEALAARWDFAAGTGKAGIPTDKVIDVSGAGLDGWCINQPDRGMTGWNWQGREEHFIHAPEQYGALWFHEDSLDDCRWEPAFKVKIPDDLRSGCYAIRLRQGSREDYIPFFVVPKRGTAKGKILLLIPTVSYLAYANSQAMQNIASCQAAMGRLAVLQDVDLELNERVKEYGLSTYDYHIDDRGVQYTSWRRPIMNMRPKYRHEFGMVWQFPADLHLVDWLEKKGFDFDVATDHDLMEQGVDLFKRYNAVVTGSHPEYYTDGMIDAWEQYLAGGGRGMYLAGNGMYWVASQHPEKPWVMEIRKGEQGDQARRARPGELYHSTNGLRGGLWRMRARGSAKVWGVTYTAHGMDTSCSFTQMSDARDPKLAWMFKGIESSEQIGDFGLVNSGAAGLEARPI
ncbi:N,N-dimethylformamidase beta subunit family domain-containing protein [Rhizobium sp. AN95]|uniref:N,N-dimethylformamidase beta subunit family domain-containing protein n=1 Tax=Rhizobium sp. AN95 TaxID=3035216 RepID=UPI002B25CC3B|nr:N,N-dimethylformamidase beta subunit family domain-containing protein [Rhizobium sp. AN95]